MACTLRELALVEECFDSVTNVGNRPTFGTELFAIETHLLNFHPIELTPETEVEIHFMQRVRDEIKFPSVDALREQIARDVKKARRHFRLLGQKNINHEGSVIKGSLRGKSLLLKSQVIPLCAASSNYP